MTGQEQIDYKKLVEAALFMTPNALSAQEIAKIISMGSVGHVERYLNQLTEEYKVRDTALEIIKIEEKYMFSIKEPYASKVSNLASGPDIGKGALRLLAYISKSNNVLQSQLVKIFGESTYAYVKELTEKEFIESKKQGRSRKISLTNKFKEYFNVGAL